MLKLQSRFWTTRDDGERVGRLSGAFARDEEGAACFLSGRCCCCWDGGISIANKGS